MAKRYVRGVIALLAFALAGSAADVAWAGQLAAEADPEYQVEFTPRTTPWLDSVEAGGIMYFLFVSPPHIERFDLPSRQWLSELALTSTPTAFWVDSDGLYVAFGSQVSRFTLQGTGEVHLCTTTNNAVALRTVGGALLVYDKYLIRSIDKFTGLLYDSMDYYCHLQGFSIAPGKNRVFARNYDVGPTDIVYFDVLPGSQLGPITDSPYHGDYPTASRCFAFPDGSQVTDDSGIVYTSDLDCSGSLAASFDDLAFSAPGPIAARDGTLVGHNAALLRTGQFTPVYTPLRIAVDGTDVVSFYGDGSEVGAEVIPLDLLQPVEPGSPVPAEGLEYLPDQVMLGDGGIVYLLSIANVAILRWSTSENRYLESIPLLSSPRHMAYSSPNQSLYISHADGEITRIPIQPDGSPGVEQAFVNSPQTPLQLATAGEYLFMCDPSGAWATHYTFSSDGGLISQEDWNYYSEEYVWCPANRRMYHFRDAVTPNTILWEAILADGTIGTQYQSGSNVGIKHPIRPSGDGALVLLGSGCFRNGDSLSPVGSLPTTISDATWVGSDPLTLRKLGAASQLQRWKKPMLGAPILPGRPIRLLDLADGVLAICELNRRPWFSEWGYDLVGRGLHVHLADGLHQAFPGQVITYTATVVNPSVSTASAHVTGELPSGLLGAVWACMATAGSSCSPGPLGWPLDDDVNLAPGGVLTYTITATVDPLLVGTIRTSVSAALGSGELYSDYDLTHVLGPAELIFAVGFETGATEEWSNSIP